MKHLIILASFVVSTLALGADTFTCDVAKKVVFSYNCVVCTQVNGDNDCVKEEVATCFDVKKVAVGASDTVVHPGNEFFLGRKTDDVSFVFGMSASGLSARVSSVKENVEATMQTSRALDPWHDSFELTAKTQKSKKVVGNVTEINLSCRPQ